MNTNKKKRTPHPKSANVTIYQLLICIHSSTDKALTVAKRRIENQYSIVGINEDLPGFFQLLELAFPSFFKGVIQIYTENG